MCLFVFFFHFWKKTRKTINVNSLPRGFSNPLWQNYQLLKAKFVCVFVLRYKKTLVNNKDDNRWVWKYSLTAYYWNKLFYFVSYLSVKTYTTYKNNDFLSDGLEEIWTYILYLQNLNKFKTRQTEKRKCFCCRGFYLIHQKDVTLVLGE